MATIKSRISVNLDKDLIELIDDFRYEKRIPSRSKAIRKLIIQSLRLNGKYYETKEEKIAREKRYKEE
jgi:metal-responsive CopG/Arc/MetJ family transcriptional regulator